MRSLHQGRPQLDRISSQVYLGGLAGLAVCGAGALLWPEQFFRSYLFAFLFWAGIALGSLAILMLHHLVAGAWGFMIQRTLEAATRTLPVVALLFVPVALGLHSLYEWTHADVVAADKVLQFKRPYLNEGFFLLRSAGYFVAWIGLAWLLSHFSGQQDRQHAERPTLRLQGLSGPGLALFVLTVSFASVDWIMSLEPHWFSTIYGILIGMGQVLSALAFAIVVTRLAMEQEPMRGVVESGHFHDLGNLLLAFVMLWAYMAFSQFLIIWSGNLPEEVPYYITRANTSWKWIGMALVGLHFAVPFLVLLSRGSKQNARLLSLVAGGILLMRLVDNFWLVAPAFHRDGLRLHVLDLLLPLAIGGIWLSAFLWQLGRRSMLPTHDPRLQEALSHHG
jgi:hypothetical protein